jgi:hypothetical protein
VRHHGNSDASGGRQDECEDPAAHPGPGPTLRPRRGDDGDGTGRLDRRRVAKRRGEEADLAVRGPAAIAASEMTGKRRLLEAAELAIEVE